jgi:hypothetical protein
MPYQKKIKKNYILLKLYKILLKLKKFFKKKTCQSLLIFTQIGLFADKICQSGDKGSLSVNSNSHNIG